MGLMDEPIENPRNIIHHIDEYAAVLHLAVRELLVCRLPSAAALGEQCLPDDVTTRLALRKLEDVIARTPFAF